MAETVPIELLDAPAQYAARPSENPSYDGKYMQLKDFLKIRTAVLDAIEKDHGSETRANLDGMAPREFCDRNFQIFRKESLVLTRSRVERGPKLLCGFGLQSSERQVYGRFGLPTKKEVFKLGVTIKETLEDMLTDDAALVRQIEKKGAVMGTPGIIEPADTADILPNTGGILRRDLISSQVFSRVVLIQRDEDAAHNEWACFVI